MKPDAGFLYVPYGSSGYLACGDELIPMENRSFEYTYHYFTDPAPKFDLKLIKYSVRDWSDEPKLRDLAAKSEERHLDKIKLFATNYLHLILIAVIFLCVFAILISFLALCKVSSCCSFGRFQVLKGGKMIEAPVKVAQSKAVYKKNKKRNKKKEERKKGDEVKKESSTSLVSTSHASSTVAQRRLAAPAYPVLSDEDEGGGNLVTLEY